ncbi:phosphonate ABC transporter, permease protein PhnE [Thioclava marina]|uniref:Phosphonate ABC transporter, permease protein PhnE n=1 Tax=Thioclava marina TaxID=1915077 RepID=A0ABX3MLG9_9RHOB|nr:MULTISPECIES: phosphonate ABC transporter, permease protein PhnE [Thioclava]OOY10938.1 phosphonate ABC transporter, permease protein PhnE [Thioclava marina]OOY27286.1 phosphonate ABC transporter, permease protein PhnE [Thioclava sp. L04-15]TNE93632.1 MAG: phosphonate ABC transporter, permease protein PhnE [Paracoccaceae bacterium]
MTMTATDINAGTRFAEIDDLFWRRRLRAFVVPLGILGYLIYILFAFDIPGLAAKARPENAAILLGDFWSYKTHVSRDNRSGEVTVAIEGERRGIYPEGQSPDWIARQGATTEITLPKGAQVTYTDKAADVLVPGYGTLHVSLEGRKVALTLPEGREMPDWISASRSRVSMDHGDWRFSMTPSRTETFRYFPGWELFFFTLDSPFHGKSLPDLVWLAVSGERVNPEMSNLSAMFGDFWNNQMWHHSDVFWAMCETVLMAFLGTMGAGLIALPLAFLAASNFTPLNAIRLSLRRFFDFLRGVDGLIWTVILSRAFGPGPLTGSLAILMTDTGTFGKMFSEALENIDGKQVEGVNSTGANALQRARFGVIPQLAPVILSQLLYYLESNTRSATVIGALVGGGIGLLLTQAIITQKDWEEVCYYVILIVLTVMAMDTISGWLRRRFIKG